MPSTLRQRLSSCPPYLLFGLALLAFIVRSAMPAGFMPRAGGLLLELSLCLPGGGQHAWLENMVAPADVDARHPTLVVSIDPPEHPSVTSGDCPGCLLGASPCLPPQPLALPVRVALAPLYVHAGFDDTLRVDRLRGPPVGSRAPPLG